MGLAPDSAAPLVPMLLTRLFIERGGVVVGLIPNGRPDASIATLTALAAVEPYMCLFLVSRIRKP